MTAVDDRAPRRRSQKGFVGQSVPRKEDRRLVQGQGVFFDDVRRHGMGYVHFVRSPYAHARIVSIDVSAALALDGVYGTLTGDEVAILTDPFFEISVAPGNQIKDYALAVGKARYMGEPVAAVVAATRELARDAAELVEVEYEPLPALVDARGARRRTRPSCTRRRARTSSGTGVFDWGDWDGRMAEADHVVRIEELHFHRFSSTPLECSRRLVEYDKRHRAVDDPLQPPDARAWARSGWRLRCASGSTSSASSPRTSAAASATRSACTRSSSSAACSRGSSAGPCSGRSGAPTSTWRTRTATSARSSTSRSP